MTVRSHGAGNLHAHQPTHESYQAGLAAEHGEIDEVDRGRSFTRACRSQHTTAVRRAPTCARREAVTSAGPLLNATD